MNTFEINYKKLLKVVIKDMKFFNYQSQGKISFPITI